MDRRFYTRESMEVIKAAKNIAALSAFYQLKFIKVLFKELDEEKKNLLFEKINEMMVPHVKWLELDRYMEEIFLKNLTITPIAVTRLCMKDKEMDIQMKPVVLKLARRVKKRCYKQRSRAEKKTV